MVSDNERLFSDILRKSGFSVTRPRKAVFAILSHEESPLAMHEILKRTDAAVDRASLYRVIKLFEQLGITQRVNVGWKYRIELTDRFRHHHHHITCIRCGQMTAIEEDTSIEQLIQTIASRQGFVPQQHQLEIQGICAACQV